MYQQELLSRVRHFSVIIEILRLVVLGFNREEILNRICRTLIDVFKCERAYFVYPVDPNVEFCRVLYEVTVPEFPDTEKLKIPIPVQPQRRLFEKGIREDKPVSITIDSPELGEFRKELAEKLKAKSILLVPLKPSGDKPWALGMHQCSYKRIWTEDEKLLFSDIAKVVTLILENMNLYEKLKEQAKHLEETNTALRVLLRQREEDKAELEERILSNVKNLIMPYIEKLKKVMKGFKEIDYLNILESNLREIVSPFSFKLSAKYLGLTPKEIQIANLIKEGRQNKEIAEILNISLETVKSHRQNIRKKLGLYNKKVNLRTFLLSLNE